jgi:hypothetical protein
MAMQSIFSALQVFPSEMLCPFAYTEEHGRKCNYPDKTMNCFFRINGHLHMMYRDNLALHPKSIGWQAS